MAFGKLIAGNGDVPIRLEIKRYVEFSLKQEQILCSFFWRKSKNEGNVKMSTDRKILLPKKFLTSTEGKIWKSRHEEKRRQRKRCFQKSNLQIRTTFSTFFLWKFYPFSAKRILQQILLKLFDPDGYLGKWKGGTKGRII